MSAGKTVGMLGRCFGKSSEITNVKSGYSLIKTLPCLINPFKTLVLLSKSLCALLSIISDC